MEMLRQFQKSLHIKTQGKSIHNITAQIQEVVRQSGISTGLCSVFVKHTSASLIIQENADPDVLVDLENFFADLVPENARHYLHSAEGPDDMPSHIRSVLTRTSEQVPISQKQLTLGIWQGIYLWEHRQMPHNREIVVHLMGS